VWVGVPAIMANATNTVAIWPGSLAAVVGFRRNLATLPRWMYWLVVPSLVGGILGAWLLMHTPERTFVRLVPLLILGATILLATQEMITKRVRSHHSAGWIVFAFVFQLGVGIYGGYFGAGIGILMLAALGLIGLDDMHQMNGLKNLLAIVMNGVAAVYFALSGAVVWRDAGIMAATAILGGFAGARLAHRFGRRFVRAAVVVIGLVMSVALFIRR